MQTFLKFKIFLLTLILLSVACFFGTTERPVFAGTADNVSGWAWNSGVGWISFNCTGDVDCSPDYGVKIDLSTGNFSGYAWNDNVGWISFNRADTGNPPSNDPGAGAGPIAKHISGDVKGWAKILSMGNDGWIRFDHGQTGETKIVSNIMTGWAYNEGTGGAGIGWISFNCSDTAGLCATSNYKVSANLNNPPMVSELPAPVWNSTNACNSGITLYADLSWKYSDDSGNDGTAYQVKATGGGQNFDTGKCLKANGVSGACTINFADINLTCLDNGGYCHYALNKTVFPQMTYGVTYNWTVTVWDDVDKVSTETSGAAFTTLAGSYPYIGNSISHLPAEINAGQPIQFTSAPEYYDAGGVRQLCDVVHCSWLWSDPNVPANLTFDHTNIFNPVITFTDPSVSSVKLRVTDLSSTQFCEFTTAGFTVKQKLPKWIETKK